MMRIERDRYHVGRADPQYLGCTLDGKMNGLRCEDYRLWPPRQAFLKRLRPQLGMNRYGKRRQVGPRPATQQQSVALLRHSGKLRQPTDHNALYHRHRRRTAKAGDILIE